MKKFLLYEAFVGRPKVAIIHMYDPATDDLKFNLIDFADVRGYMWNDPDLEEKFANESDDIDAIIISGSHSDPTREDAPDIPESIVNSGKPILGICYGYEWWMQRAGAKLVPLKVKEDMIVEADIKQVPLFKGLNTKLAVVMKHDYIVENMPEGYETIASTETTPHAGVQNTEIKFWGLQFHPEKSWIHDIIFQNFLEINRIH
jgi:GMP synthase-like glutamine amidotransferase